jgi:hypothetical protein
MRLPGLALLLVSLALVAAGCSTEGPEQLAARAVVERHVLPLAGYDPDRIRCTGNPRPWFIEQAATVYLCAVGRDDGDCDWFRVTVSNGDAEVELDRPRAGCVLPV